LNGILLHFHNAEAHNSRLSSEKIESEKAQGVPDPSYGSDPTEHELISSSLVIWKKNSAGHRSLRATI
jgi:hypothetical protein